MKISFFEEFPTTQNLQKLRLLKYPVTLYVAARSVAEFEKISKQALKIKKGTKTVYWPILSLEEGYWISPWSSPQALRRIFTELQERKPKKEIAVMLDLEIPKRKSLVLTRVAWFLRNKMVLKRFIREADSSHIKLFTIEISHLPQWTLGILGLSYPNIKQQRMGMYYSSFIRPFLPKDIVLERFRTKMKYYAAHKIIPGIGLIAPGIYQHEPTYGMTELQEELHIAREEDVSEVVIFRLGGLNKKIAKIVKQYV